MEPLQITIIGAGRVGSAMACLLKEFSKPGPTLCCIAAKTEKSLEKVRKIMGKEAGRIILTTNIGEAAQKSNCLMIAVPDNAIEGINEYIFEEKKKQNPGYVIHFSGSKQLSVLRKAEQRGAEVGCMHPIKSFASIEQSVNTMGNTVFGITYSHQTIKDLMVKIITLIKGSYIEVPDEKKPIYHAACCAASNYVVTLLDYAADISKKAGLNTQEFTKALIGLTEGTIENIKSLGIKESLTGPIARGDAETIESHLKHLSDEGCPQEIYRELGKKTAEIAYTNQWIEQNAYRKLLEILKNDVNK